MTLIKTLLTDAFSALSNKNFRIYALGQTVSLVGTFMQQTAQQWLVWNLTHDSRWIGITAALGFVPMLLLGPFTGALADRVNRRKLLLATQSLELLLAFGLAGFAFSGSREIWPVLLLAALLGIVAAFTFPAQSALIGDMTGMGEIRRAYAFLGAMVETGRLVGPAVAGQVVAWFGTAFAFFINGLSFVAVIISLLFVRTRQAKPQVTSNVWQGFVASLHFVKTQARLLDLLLCRIYITMFVFSSLQLSAPIADGVLHGGPQLLGTMLATSGAGALLGALIVAPQLIKLSRVGLAFCVVLLWSGLWQIVGSLAPQPLLVLGSVFAYSAGIPIVLTGVNALVQMLSPAQMRGRIVSLSQMLSFGTQPLGALLVGWLGNAFGPMLALRINGVLMTLVVLGLLILRPDFRRWRLTDDALEP